MVRYIDPLTNTHSLVIREGFEIIILVVKV
jgi:hypothetical protein